MGLLSQKAYDFESRGAIVCMMQKLRRLSALFRYSKSSISNEAVQIAFVKLEEEQFDKDY